MKARSIEMLSFLLILLVSLLAFPLEVHAEKPRSYDYWVQCRTESGCEGDEEEEEEPPLPESACWCQVPANTLRCLDSVLKSSIKCCAQETKSRVLYPGVPSYTAFENANQVCALPEYIEKMSYVEKTYEARATDDSGRWIQGTLGLWGGVQLTCSTHYMINKIKAKFGLNPTQCDGNPIHATSLCENVPVGELSCTATTGMRLQPPN